MATEEKQPTAVEQVTSAISDAASKVTDEAAALFGSAKEAVVGESSAETKSSEDSTMPKSIAEAAPVRIPLIDRPSWLTRSNLCADMD